MDIPESGFTAKQDFIVRARKSELDIYSKYRHQIPARVRRMWLEIEVQPGIGLWR